MTLLSAWIVWNRRQEMNLNYIKQRIARLEKKFGTAAGEAGYLFFNTACNKWCIAGVDKNFKTENAALKYFENVHNQNSTLIIDDIENRRRNKKE